MTVVVREVKTEDFDDWRALWQGYLDFAQSTLDETITLATWARVHSVNGSLICRVVEFNDRMVGFALCVMHEGTWVTQPVCYLEDLFVDPSVRGKGAGKALINALVHEGRQKGWAKVYWVTRGHNPARKLYDQVATLDDVVRYSVRTNFH